ncbi:MAG: acyloxyacyl hydrolase [Bacteroidetes bacterium]|nr:acyloxyacyl hydrolase [Bacteroidota bacterium]
MKTSSFWFNIIFILVLVFHFTSLHASGDKRKIYDNKRHKIGIQRGFSFQNGLAVDYIYRVHYFQLQYHYAFFVTKNWSFELVFQPQYNEVQLKNDREDAAFSKAWEVGLNGGLMVRKNILKDRLGFFACVSSGPHYLSQSVPRQAHGFIFSDNFFAGINIKLIKIMHLDTRFGLRHVSNAGIKNPNGGINNLFGSLGLFFVL